MSRPIARSAKTTIQLKLAAGPVSVSDAKASKHQKKGQPRSTNDFRAKETCKTPWRTSLEAASVKRRV